MNYKTKHLRPADKKICSYHFLDNHIQNFIIEKRKVMQCDYCEEIRMCCTLPELTNDIENSFRFDYSDPFTLGIDFSPEVPLHEYRFYGIEIEEVKYILDREIKLKDFAWDIVDDVSELFKNEFLFRRLLDVNHNTGETESPYL